MVLNKSYYLKLRGLEIVSGEVDHDTIDDNTLETIKSVISEPLKSGSLFTGDHLVTKKVKSFSIATGKTVEYDKVENLANLAIEEGFVRVVEFNTQTKVLRCWIQHPDYKKQGKSSDNSSDLDTTGQQF